MAFPDLDPAADAAPDFLLPGDSLSFDLTAAGPAPAATEAADAEVETADLPDAAEAAARADAELHEALPEPETAFAPGEALHDIATVKGMYQNYFLDYASYVILERAVPAIEDGLKPVQRRILHAMKEMDDGRFNKVANVIGQTMQYHPHGALSESCTLTISDSELGLAVRYSDLLPLVPLVRS